ncbi:MAG: hypothetical protein JKX97_07610 [Candidatus Lindowbacteria bacterium]|nr:hypothetical protein [Candidatus Lindowbacteria bacterium]
MDRKKLELLIFWVVLAIFGTLILLKGTELYARNKGDVDKYKENAGAAEKYLENIN